MRICHVITRFIRGGADENTLLSCNGQVAAGHEVYLIHGLETDDRLIQKLDPTVQRRGIAELRRPVSPANDVLAVVKLQRLLSAIKPDLVHTHTSKAGVLGRIAAAFTGTPIIIHGVHILPFINIGPFSRLLYKSIEQVCDYFTDAYVCVGDDMRATCLRAGIGTPEKHHVIPSGMDLSKFTNARAITHDWKALLPGVRLHTDKPRFLVLVSRLEARKGQHEFLAVFAELARVEPNAVLLLVGEGPDRARLERRIDALSLQNRVLLTGFREDVECLMAISDIGLLTSIREGLPRILVQYAIMGLPVIATDIPGVREIITPNVTGFLVPSTDLAQMMGPLQTLLRSEATRMRISSEIRILPLSRWSRQSMIDQLEQLYASLFREKCLRV